MMMMVVMVVVMMMMVVCDKHRRSPIIIRKSTQKIELKLSLQLQIIFTRYFPFYRQLIIIKIIIKSTL